MADPPRHPDTGDDAGVAPDRGPAARRSHRVAALLWIIGIVLVLGFLALHLTGALGPGGH